VRLLPLVGTLLGIFSPSRGDALGLLFLSDGLCYVCVCAFKYCCGAN